MCKKKFHPLGGSTTETQRRLGAPSARRPTIVPYGDAPGQKTEITAKFSEIELCGEQIEAWPPCQMPKNHGGAHYAKMGVTESFSWSPKPLHLRLLDKMKEILRVR
jgi:hypothetical protein